MCLHMAPVSYRLLGDFIRTIRNIERTTTTTAQTERDKIFTNFEKLFKTNRTNKDAEIKKQLKPAHLPVKQKARPIPYQLQSYVEKEITKLIQYGLLEKIQNVEEDCFISPVVRLMKKTKLVKTAMDIGKFTDSCMKMRPHIPIMEQLLRKTSTEITRVQNEPLWILKIDIEYTNGQLKLSEETNRKCKFAITDENMNKKFRLQNDFTVRLTYQQNPKKK